MSMYEVHTQADAGWVCHWNQEAWLCLLGSSVAQAAASLVPRRQL